MCFFDKLSIWDFKHNILDVTLMNRNQCINFCPEKCKPGKIPICYKSWNAPQLAPAPGIWRVEIQTLANKSCSFLTKYFFSKAYQFCTICSRDLQEISMKAYWQYLSEKVYKILLACQIQGIWAFWWEKKNHGTHFSMVQ